eukprot:1760471-Pleurochrysis_carterae.AAC.1
MATMKQTASPCYLGLISSRASSPQAHRTVEAQPRPSRSTASAPQGHAQYNQLTRAIYVCVLLIPARWQWAPARRLMSVPRWGRADSTDVYAQGGRAR